MGVGIGMPRMIASMYVVELRGMPMTTAFASTPLWFLGGPMTTVMWLVMVIPAIAIATLGFAGPMLAEQHRTSYLDGVKRAFPTVAVSMLVASVGMWTTAWFIMSFPALRSPEDLWFWVVPLWIAALGGYLTAYIANARMVRHGWRMGGCRMQPLLTLGAVVLLTIIFLLAILVLTWAPAGEPLEAPTTANASLLALTGTTARLAGPDHVMTAVSYAQTICAAAQDKDRPGAVILVRDDDPAVAVAVTRLQHYPVNAPLLYLTEEGRTIPDATRAELERLDPEGVMMDNNVQVYLAGNVSEEVAREIEDLDVIVRRIAAPDPVAFTKELDDYLAVLDSNHQEVVLVGSLDALPFAYAGANWNAHMGRGFAFVTRDGVPEATRRILEANWPDTTYLFVFAPPSEVNATVMAELSRYGHVQRIPGETPQEMAVRWAGYKDSGREEDWWFGFDTRSVGWGYAEPGHNVILANPSDWRTTVPTGVLSHMGKHAFLLLTDESGSLPQATRDYLKVLRPTRTHPSEQVYNFGWVTGPGVPDATVREVADLLSVADGT